MTLEELKQRCEKAGFQYAYGVFKESTEPPHLVSICLETDNYMADGVVYNKDIPVQLDYTYIFKDIEEQNKIEKEILGDIPWNKSEESYLSNEEVWQVSYYFNVNEKEEIKNG